MVTTLKTLILDNQGATLNLAYSVGLFILLICLKRSTLKVCHKIKGDSFQLYTYRKIFNSIFTVLYLFTLLFIWQDSSSFIAFLGLFTGGVAIAMKEFLMNIGGCLYILWSKPFLIGDRIEIGSQVGDVIDVSLLHFSVLEVGKRILGEQSTGRIIHIPNMQIFNTPLANYEKGFGYIWHELVIPLRIDSDWALAKEIIYPIAHKHCDPIIEQAKKEIEQAGKKYLIYYSNLTPIIYTEIKDNKILLTLRYLCEPRQARMTEHIIWEQILTTLSKETSIFLGGA